MPNLAELEATITHSNSHGFGGGGKDNYGAHWKPDTCVVSQAPHVTIELKKYYDLSAVSILSIADGRANCGQSAQLSESPSGPWTTVWDTDTGSGVGPAFTPKGNKATFAAGRAQYVKCTIGNQLLAKNVWYPWAAIKEIQVHQVPESAATKDCLDLVK